jgi:hypothetical protein
MRYGSDPALDSATAPSGVRAAQAKLRAAVTPAHRGVGSKTDTANPDQSLTPRHVAMTWAQRLKRTRCGGQLKVIASIEEPEVIARILAHLQKVAPDQRQAELHLMQLPVVRPSGRKDAVHHPWQPMGKWLL